MKNFNRNAFTLVEVLVALAISSMVLLIGTIGMKVLINSLNKEASTLPYKAMSYFQIRSIIIATYPYVTYTLKPFSKNGNEYAFFYNGDQTHLQFITQAPLSDTKNLTIVEFRLNNQQLLYREVPLYSAQIDYLHPFSTNDIPFTVLNNTMKEAKFSYEVNTSIISSCINQLPKAVFLDFIDEKGKNQKYIFKIQTDFNQQIDRARVSVESI